MKTTFLTFLAILCLLAVPLIAMNVHVGGRLDPCGAARQLAEVRGDQRPEPAGIADHYACQRVVVLHVWRQASEGRW